MSIGDFLHSKRWKLMQNYIYSWGASVVLIGALFKLEHIQGASVFLGVGLSIEAIIFFISAFEPLMELPDWKAVYPQLRTGEEKPREIKKHDKADSLYPTFFGGGGGGSIDLGGLPDEQLKSLKSSLDKLSEAAKGIKDISNATEVTNGFVKNLNEASLSIGSVVEANNKVATAMDQSGEAITKSYQEAAESTKSVMSSSSNYSKTLDNQASNLEKSYGEMTSSLVNGFKGLEKSSSTYTDGVEKLNKNIAAVNAAYELHLKGASQVEAMVNDYSKGVGEMGKLLNNSVEETKKFNQNTKAINENIQALNDVYGRMLGALNGKK